MLWSTETYLIFDLLTFSVRPYLGSCLYYVKALPFWLLHCLAHSQFKSSSLTTLLAVAVAQWVGYFTCRWNLEVKGNSQNCTYLGSFGDGRAALDSRQVQWLWTTGWVRFAFSCRCIKRRCKWTLSDVFSSDESCILTRLSFGKLTARGWHSASRIWEWLKWKRERKETKDQS